MGIERGGSSRGGDAPSFHGVPRLGLVTEPLDVTTHPESAERLGLDWLGFVRDDRLEQLHGGSKVRKLDYLLAAEPWASAPRWVSSGAIGSGHLVAVTAAAEWLERSVDALCFWEPLSERVLENLAFTAGHAGTLAYRHSRPGLWLRYPRAVTGRSWGSVAVIPPGASCAIGTVGIVQAALELAERIHSGDIPRPDRLYVALGSCGTVAGLALGLGMAGIPIPVHAVAAVERILSPRFRLDGIVRATRDLLERAGVSGAASAAAAPVVIDRSQLGPGYGSPTVASEAACSLGAELGVPIEAVYSGKALAALESDARAGAKGRALLWVTARSAEPLPAPTHWREHLPDSLTRRLTDPRGWTRRRVIVTSAATAVALTAGMRLGGYPPWPGWDGAVLSTWEAHVIRACARALLPPAPDEGAFDRVAVNVDRYVRWLPAHARRELHAALATVEHATTPLGLRWSRLTELEPAEGERWLSTLASRGGLQRQLYRGVRDLCMVGYYQQPESWPALGYGGPLSRPAPLEAYARLKAPAGAQPRGWTT